VKRAWMTWEPTLNQHLLPETDDAREGR
jgi:hypothetical protein